MNCYQLNVNSDSVGGYFSSEQIDLLSIIQCKNHDDLVSFINQCEQLSNVFSEEDFQCFINYDLESFKRIVFEKYQDTLVFHDSDKLLVLENLLYHCGLSDEDIHNIRKIYMNENIEMISSGREYIKNEYPDHCDEIFKKSHRFISTERDGLKTENLYDEFVMLNERLIDFDTILISSGKLSFVMNELFDESNEERFDFYYTLRDLNFAYRNNKHVRFHSLLTRDLANDMFVGRSKEEVLSILQLYVRKTIDFIHCYNACHKLKDGSFVIQAVDLFNEIVSFDTNSRGEYDNIWESRYGITIHELCSVFKYARENKSSNMSYLYNEPFLENSKRREKVIAILQEINTICPFMIDTLGSQMHITIQTPNDDICSCFHDLKKLQSEFGYNIQITEFDMSLGKNLIFRVTDSHFEFSEEQVINYKQEKIGVVSDIINQSFVCLSGVSYWSLTDTIDHNLERIKTDLIQSGYPLMASQLKTVYGGLYSFDK